MASPVTAQPSDQGKAAVVSNEDHTEGSELCFTRDSEKNIFNGTKELPSKSDDTSRNCKNGNTDETSVKLDEKVDTSHLVHSKNEESSHKSNATKNIPITTVHDNLQGTSSDEDSTEETGSQNTRNVRTNKEIPSKIVLEKGTTQSAVTTIDNATASKKIGSPAPLFINMPHYNNNLSFLPAGLPPGRYVILPSTTSVIPSITNITPLTSTATSSSKCSTVMTATNSSSIPHLPPKLLSMKGFNSKDFHSPIHMPLLGNLASSKKSPKNSGLNVNMHNGTVRSKRRSYTTAEKLAMIEAVESGQRKTAVADHFGVSPSTLACILLQKDKIRSYQLEVDLARRRIRQPGLKKLPNNTNIHLGAVYNSPSAPPFTDFRNPLPDTYQRPLKCESGTDFHQLNENIGDTSSCDPLAGTSSSDVENASFISTMHVSQMPLSGMADFDGQDSSAECDDSMAVKTETYIEGSPEVGEDYENAPPHSNFDRSESPSPISGMAGPYLLKKETHCSTILDQLMKDESFTDVTLTAEGQSIKAHKMVLCLASTYFRQVLNKEANVQSVIVFRDIKFDELKSLINFIYTGEATVDASDLESFMRTADMLEVTSLCDGQCSIPRNFLSKTPKEPEHNSRPNKRQQNQSFSPSNFSNNDDSSPQQKSKRQRRPSPSTESQDNNASSVSSPPENFPFVETTTSIKKEPDVDDSMEAVCSPRDPSLSDPGEGDGFSYSVKDSLTPDKLIPGRCPFCPDSETLREGPALTNHFLISHPDKTAFACDNCSKVFLKEGLYKSHTSNCFR